MPYCPLLITLIHSKRTKLLLLVIITNLRKSVNGINLFWT